MENNITSQELIDRYILGRMSVEEKTNFENQIKNDMDLSKEIKMQQLIIEEINERNSLFQIMKKADKSNRIRHLTSYSIAASFLIILSIGIWQPTKMSNKSIFNTYYEKYPISEEVGPFENGTRGSISLLLKFDSIEQEKIVRSLENYKIENYIGTSSILERIESLKERSADLVLILAVSQLNSGDLEKASINLEFLGNMTSFNQRETALFYLALSKLKAGKLGKAREILRNLESGQGEYSKKSGDILNKMRYF